ISGIEMSPVGWRVGSYPADAGQSCFSGFELDADINSAGLQLDVDGQTGLFQISVVVEFPMALRHRFIEFVEIGACDGFDCSKETIFREADALFGVIFDQVTHDVIEAFPVLRSSAYFDVE